MGDADTDVASLQPGDVLRERYVIEGRLGSGGMGVVYRARDLEQETTLALKTLRRRFDAVGLLRFKREFRSLADLIHRNIVLLHDLVRDQDLWFFTMELVDGVPFGPSAPLREAFSQIVDGVNAIHASGRIHRDLKPSNVLVTPSGRVVILDFGLVGDAQPTEAERGAVDGGGTPAYMAPEQIAGHSAGPATDWFAVGVMLFQRLTGRLPWGGSADTLLVRRLSERAPRPSTFAQGVPADLDELCWQMLAIDPRERPTGEAIREQMNAGRETSPSSPPPRKELFVGRDDEMRVLRDVFDSAPSYPCIVQVRGPPGMGKSSLARHFVASVAADGHLTLTTRCHARESVPFAALDALGDQLAREWRVGTNESMPYDESAALRRAFPVLEAIDAGPRSVERSRPASEDELRLRQIAGQGLRRLIRATSRNAPFVLWIDDFQWADADSARLLGDILAPPDAPKVVLLITSREILSPRLMGEVTSGGRVDCTTIELGPLSADDTLELAMILSPTAGARAVAIAAESSGHPFFVEVLARSDAEHLPNDALAPSSLDSAIRLRIDHLEPELRQILTAVAVAGQPIAQAVAVRAANSSADSAAVRALCARSFLRVASGQTVEPYHDRIRDVVYEGLEPSARATWHGSLAIAFEGHGSGGPDLLANHFFLAGDLAAARTYAIEGAERASRALAFDRAAELFALARRAETDADADTPRLARRHAEALFSARRGREAAEIFLEVATLTGRPEEAAEAEQRAISSYFIAGHIASGLGVLEPLLHREGIDVPHEGDALRGAIMTRMMRLMQRGFEFALRDETTVERGALTRLDLLRTATDAWSSLDPPRATAFLLEATPLALDAGEPHRIAWALCHVGLFFASMANEDMQGRGAALLDSAEALVERSSAVSLRGAVELARARACLSVGKFREGIRFSELCLARAQAEGVGPNVVEVAQTVRLYGMLACGDVPRLAALLPGLQADARRRADAYGLVTVRLYVAHLRLLTAGDAEGAIALVDAAVTEWGERRMLFQSWLGLRTRVLCELYAGRAERAYAELLRVWPLLESSGLLALGVVRPEALRLKGITALSHKHAGSRAEVESVCDALSERRPDEAAARLTFRASVLLEDGRRDEAVELLRRARATHRLAGQRLDAWTVGAALRRVQGAEVEPAARHLRAAGIHDPSRWVPTLAPFVGGGPG